MEADSNMNILELQVSAFGDYMEIIPTPERITNLMMALKGFLPVTNRAIHIDADRGTVENIPRIHMQDQDSSWKIEIQPDRINAVFSSSDTSEGIDSLIDNGLNLIHTTCESIDVKRQSFTRLATNIQLAYPSGKEKPEVPFIGKFPKQITNPDNLLEWTVSFNNKGSLMINDNKEETNEIMSCALGMAKGDPSKFAMLLTVDINTTQNDLRERFGIEQFDEFIKYAKVKISEIIENFSSGTK